MVKCFLCPKRGGAMKPTNIFRSYSKYYDQKIKILTKKTGKSQIEKLQNLAQQQSQIQNMPEDSATGEPHSQGKDGMPPSMLFKQQVLQRLENNCCLSELLTREFQYHQKTFTDYYEEVENNKDCTSEEKKKGLNCYQKLFEEQEKYELNFNKHEKKNHCIPEDYSHFIQRNEYRLELLETPVTDSLYHWVHHSCSMWT